MPALGFGSIMALSIGLAMDATAVSATRGLATPVIRPKHAALVAIYFGGFQALMPALGWFLGQWLGPIVAAWSHWIAFVLLLLIGGKMVKESLGESEESGEVDSKANGSTTSDTAEQKESKNFGPLVMFGLAVATSIDAFAVGVTLPMLEAPFVLSIVTIGITTAALSIAGLFAGRRFGAMVGRRLDILGGGILILLAVKILVDKYRG